MREVDIAILIFFIIFIAYVFFGLAKPVNLLIFTMYIIGVVYIFNRARESVDDQIKVTFVRDALNEELEKQSLQNLISIDSQLKDSYEIDKLHDLPISIQNKSEGDTIYVDWDNSSLTGYDGRSRRVIRLTSTMSQNSSQTQVESVIAPGKTLKERLTAEDALAGNAVSDGAVKVGPLISLTNLKKGKPDEKKLYNGFMNKSLVLKFDLRLMLHMFSPISASERRLHVVDCPFIVSKLPWTVALPWNQKK